MYVAPSLRPAPIFACLVLSLGLRAQVEWNVTEFFPPLSHFAMAYDDARGRVVVWSGAETWERGATGWSSVPSTARPDALGGAAMVYVPTRGRSILFGGETSLASGVSNATWCWDGQAWTRLAPLVAPAPRYRHAMAYDIARDRLVLFGGSTDSNSRGGSMIGDTWEWDGVTWTRVGIGGLSPAPRFDTALAYDPVRQRVVMFGGDGGSGTLGDTWEWDGTSWLLRPAPVRPPNRSGHAMEFDWNRGRIVLFGGSPVGLQQMNDMWEWDGTAWTQLSPSASPSARHGHRMVWDHRGARMLLFGGQVVVASNLADLWAWDGTSWARLQGPSSGPPWGEAVAFDSLRGVTVLVTRLGPWEWDGTSWTEKPVASTPALISGSVPMAFDAARGVTVMYEAGETWLWNGTAWTRSMLASSPPTDRGAAMAYDSIRQRVVLYGGFVAGTNSTSGETWEWDGASWLLRANWGPPRLAVHGMAFDEARGVTVMYGGSTSFSSGAGTHQTWEWDGNTWRQCLPLSHPLASDWISLAYDSRRQRVVAFGGRPGTWEWDGLDWVARGVAAEPAAPLRQFKRLAYDSWRGRCVMYDGAVWEYGPVHAAELSFFGSGCAGSLGTPTLATSSNALPWIGDSFTIVVVGAGVFATGCVHVGMSDASWSGITLPLPLAGLGMPGCDLLAAPEVAVPLAPGPGFRARVPFDVTLNGAEFFMQAVINDPAANAAGLVVSDAAALRIGGR